MCQLDSYSVSFKAARLSEQTFGVLRDITTGLAFNFLI